MTDLVPSPRRRRGETRSDESSRPLLPSQPVEFVRHISPHQSTILPTGPFLSRPSSTSASPTDSLRTASLAAGPSHQASNLWLMTEDAPMPTCHLLLPVIHFFLPSSAVLSAESDVAANGSGSSAGWLPEGAVDVW